MVKSLHQNMEGAFKKTKNKNILIAAEEPSSIFHARVLRSPVGAPRE